VSECVKCRMPGRDCVCKVLEAEGDTICYDCGAYTIRCVCMVSRRCEYCRHWTAHGVFGHMPTAIRDKQKSKSYLCPKCNGTGYVTIGKYGFQL